MSYFNSNHYIVSLVSSNILPQGKGPNLPNHWVVWSSTLNGENGKLIHNETKANENIDLTVFSWGGMLYDNQANDIYGV